jgi:hypothetical protein
MIKLYFLLGSIQFLIAGHAQLLDPSNPNAASGIYLANSNKSNESWHIDWSFAESISIKTFIKKNGAILSTGFLQPSFTLDPLLTGTDNYNFKLQWGPNPVSNDIRLACQQAGVDIMSIVILDREGNILHQIQGPFSGLHFSKQISFASVNTGIYFIAINYIVAANFKHVKIIKVIKI